MKKNLIVDGQILQTDAWYRGMGKYIIQVLRELSLNTPVDIEITLLFNTEMTCEKTRFDVVKFLCPNIKQVHVSLPLAVNSHKKTGADKYRRELEKHIQKLFYSTDNYYLITSLFLFDFFAEFPNNCRKLLLFYDLTPLLFWRDLGGYFPPDLYMSRFQRLLDAECIFSISETTRQDLLNVFGLPPNRVVNINGGFTKVAETVQKPTNFELPRHYVLFPTGNLPHKNNVVAVKGFEQYCRESGKGIKLLITSHFQDNQKDHLRALSNNIIFTDNVSDEELEWLYENADSVLFASKYEGLGMPILDAVASQKPVITSRIPVFQEMSKEAFYYFDPTSPDSMAEALRLALDRESFLTKAKLYPEIMKKYTWANTAAVINSELRSFKKTEKELPAASNSDKPYIAVVSLNPGISGQIGRDVEALHLSLSQHFQIDYYFDANGYHYRDIERPTFIDHVASAFDITKLNLDTYRHYQEVVYFIDKASLPSRAAQRACVLPGIVVEGSMEHLSRQDQLLRTLICNNQESVIKLKDLSYDSNQQLVVKLSKRISEKSHQLNPRKEIIIRGGSGQSIIKRLKELHSS